MLFPSPPSWLPKRTAALLAGVLLLWGGLPLLDATQRAAAQKDEATTGIKSVSIVPSDQRPTLSVQAQVTDPSDGVFEAGEEATLTVTVENRGDGAARGLEVWAASENSLSGLRLTGTTPPNDTGAVRLGRPQTLGPSSTTTVSGPLVATDEVKGGSVPIRIAVRDAEGHRPEQPATLAVQTKAYQSPSLTLAGYETPGRRRQDKIPPGSTTRLRIRIQNTGPGPARDIEATFSTGSNGSIVRPSARTLGTVEPGGTATMPVQLSAPARGETIPVRLALQSTRDPYETTLEIPISVATPVDQAIPQTDMARPNAIAVVIGNKTYRNDDIPDVKYAARDAQVTKKYLTRTLGVRNENVIYAENATAAALTRIFGTAGDPKGQLYNYVQPGESEVFVYYSGHGAPSPESGRAYLVPSNANPNYLSQNGYPVRQLYENLAKVPAKSVTVMLEACFSGVSAGGTVLRRASPVELSVENPVLAMENGLALTAGAADQIASWYPLKKHGLFTYFFLKGLREPADRDGDRAITGAEMGQYLTEKVPYRARRMYNREQTPQVVGPAKDRVLVRLGDR